MGYTEKTCDWTMHRCFFFLSVKYRPYVPIHFRAKFTQSEISHEDERFPHTGFTTGSSRSCGFAVVPNIELLGFKVTSVLHTLLNY